jgi:tetratricopeptide (TPR) repeat protein
LGIPQIVCFILSERGELHLARGEAEEAEQAYREMLTTVPPGSQDLDGLAQYGLARALLAQGKGDEAARVGMNSVRILEAIGHVKGREARAWYIALVATEPGQSAGSSDDVE